MIIERIGGALSDRRAVSSGAGTQLPTAEGDELTR